MKTETLFETPQNSESLKTYDIGGAGVRALIATRLRLTRFRAP